MHFGLSDTQQAIRNSAREFFAAECPMPAVRRLAESDAAFDPALWTRCAEQGWTGMIFPEEYEGAGLGLVDMAAAWEEMGRALVPGPFLSTVLLAGTILDHAASGPQKRQYLRGICRGELQATLALLESSASWAPEAVQVEARAAGDRIVVNGDKLFVADAAIAGLVLAAVRLDGDLAIVMVPGGTAGLQMEKMPALDLTRRLYRVTFADVTLGASSVLVRGDAAREAVEAALDVACVGLAAEMVGGMQHLLDMTVAYANTREQFGRKIGAFQAVQHQCADMLLLLEGARSAAYYAAWAVTERQHDARAAVSVAKAYAGDAYREVGNRSIQVQGGMGFTWENDAHLYYRRARASEIACGDATFHRERIARFLLSPSIPGRALA